MVGAFVDQESFAGGGLPGTVADPSGMGEVIVFTRSSLMRERVSIEGGRRFARRQGLVAQAAELFTERMRSWVDQKTTPGLLTLYSDLQTVDKKERVFDQLMGDATIGDDVKDALIQWMLDTPAEAGRGG